MQKENILQVSKPSWRKFKNLYYIEGDALSLINKDTVLVYDDKPVIGDYYFIQVKNPPETMKVSKNTIFFIPFIQDQTAHQFLAKILLKLEVDHLNSGGELTLDKDGRIERWSVKTCSFYKILGLDTEKNIPAKVGLPKEVLKEVETTSETPSKKS